MPGIDRLFVIWSEPTKGGRHVIGRLERGGGIVRFWYERDLSSARACGFELLPEFPAQRLSDTPYSAGYLFPLFAERIPAPSRPDAAEMMREWGVERPDDQFEVLAKSGGLRATDRIELAEYRVAGDDLDTPIEFRVAARGRIADAAELGTGDRVTLRPEPTNEVDPFAVIVDRDRKRAGYVPKHYTGVVGSLLEREVPMDAVVIRKLVVPDDAGKWVVRLSRR